MSLALGALHPSTIAALLRPLTAALARRSASDAASLWATVKTCVMPKYLGSIRLVVHTPYSCSGTVITAVDTHLIERESACVSDMRPHLGKQHAAAGVGSEERCLWCCSTQ